MVNDGSKDDTEEVLGRFKEDHDNLETVSFFENRGVNFARRVGTGLVPEEAIVVEADDHDILLPGVLREIAEAFKDKKTYLIYGDCERIREDGSHIDTWRKYDYEPGFLRIHGNLTAGVRAYRKSLYTAVGGWPDEFPAGDYLMTLRMELYLDGKGIRKLPRAICRMRVASPSISITFWPEAEANTERFRTWAMREVLKSRLKVKGGDREKPLALLVFEHWGSSYGGGEISKAYIARAMVEVGFEVVVLHRTPASKTKQLQALEGIEITEICSSFNEEVLLEQIEALGPSIIVSNSWDLRRVVPVAKNLEIPVVGYVQYWNNIIGHSQAYDGLARDPVPEESLDPEGIRTLKECTKVLANSPFTAEVVRKTVRRSAEVAKPPINKETVRIEVHQPEFIIMLSGQYLKGGEVFLGLARAFPEEKFRIYFSVFHREHQEEWSKYWLQSLQGQPNIEILDWEDDVRDIYRSAKVVLLPTQTAESFSRVAAEARLNGIPILASDAGNLPNIVLPGGGIVLSKSAPQEEWNNALQELLSGKVEIKASDEWCTNDAPKFAQICKELVMLHKIAIVYGGGPGVETLVKHLSGSIGVRIHPASQHGSLRFWGDEMVIWAGGFNGTAREFLEGVKGKKALLWCSNLSQMSFDLHEVKTFAEAIQLLKEGGLDYIFTTSKEDAETFSKGIHPNFRYLPACFDSATIGTRSNDKFEGFAVGLLGPFHIRKNFFTAPMAVAGAGGILHLSSWLTKSPYFEQFIQSLGVKYQVHETENKEAYYDMLTRCHATLCLSLAETFCYSAAESMLLRVPVVGTDLVPVLRYGDKSLKSRLLVKPFDTEEIVERLKYLREHPGEMENLGSLAREHCLTVLEKNKQIAQVTLIDCIEREG